jgi:hypothetical protein
LPVPVSYSGGAYRVGDLLIQPFVEALQPLCPDFEVRAALYASKLSGATIQAQT